LIFSTIINQESKWAKIFDFVLDKEQREKLIFQVDKLAMADQHPKWQQLRSLVLRTVKDQGHSTILLVKSRFKRIGYVF
jgi:hypothetical protein